MSDLQSVIVVAGASCAGKTTFLRTLRTGYRPHLPDELQALDLSAFKFANAMDLTDSRGVDTCPSNLILHYDIFRPITFYGQLDFRIDPVLHLVMQAVDRTVLTLWEEPGVLRDRSVARRRALWTKVVRRSSLHSLRRNLNEYRGAKQRRDAMIPWFADRHRLWRLYETWFEFIRKAGVDRHWLTKTSDAVAFEQLDGAGPLQPLWSLEAEDSAQDCDPVK